ncbi:hypothetical protein F4801DRAFT_240124 [Xylaria longipes]|nr:hypothetical protein F4801DRAFT_240124 [Xylaria longipes]
MAEPGKLARDVSTTTYPILTTTFTPLPECSSWYLDYCTERYCTATAFPRGYQLCGIYPSYIKNSIACYPELSTSFDSVDSINTLMYVDDARTYSPGIYCPFGMSTAQSVPFVNGVFCCPSGMTLVRGDSTCLREVITGTFILPGCTRTTIGQPAGQPNYKPADISYTTTISITARALFLAGQTILNPSSSPTSFLSNSSSGSAVPIPLIPNTPSPGHGHARPSIGLKVGLGVGITLGVILLLALCAFRYVRAYRKRMDRERTPRGLTPADILQVDKPELAGCTFQEPYVKVELDSMATRAELEAPSEEIGAGIFVHKPELQGSDGHNVLGVYVKRKAELEA